LAEPVRQVADGADVAAVDVRRGPGTDWTESGGRDSPQQQSNAAVIEDDAIDGDSDGSGQQCQWRRLPSLLNLGKGVALGIGSC
jgi:hypothetical protein